MLDKFSRRASGGRLDPYGLAAFLFEVSLYLFANSFTFDTPVTNLAAKGISMNNSSS